MLFIVKYNGEMVEHEFPANIWRHFNVILCWLKRNLDYFLNYLPKIFSEKKTY